LLAAPDQEPVVNFPDVIAESVELPEEVEASTVTEADFRAEIVNVFKSLDMDRNNVLDHEECREFVAAVMKPLGGYDANAFRATYDAIDKNDDGLIQQEELVERVVELGRGKGLFTSEGMTPTPIKSSKTTLSNFRKTSIRSAAETDVTPAGQVSRQIFKEGLSCLGKTFNNARHAYLKLNISNRALDTVSGIQKFRYVIDIDVSDNNLTTLEPLSAIKHFIKLNARNNQLTTLLDFDPPANLEIADYTCNKIQKIENCELNPYLKKLYLDENEIGRIEGLSTNKSL